MATKTVSSADAAKKAAQTIPSGLDLVALKEITPTNVSLGDNPQRLLAAAENTNGWVNGQTNIPDLLSTLIVHGSAENRLKAVGILGKAAKEGMGTYALMHIVGEALEYGNSPEVDAALKGIVLQQNKLYGLEDEAVLGQWLKTDDISNRGHMLFLNVNALNALHKKRPDAAKALHEAYGISCFGRYKTETMVRLYDSMKESPKTMGLAIFCRSDWGGMFYDLMEPIERLSKDFNIKIIEGEEPDELRRTMENVKRMHGKKAQFAVVVMHADTLDSLLDRTLGDYEGAFGAFLEKDPTFVMISSYAAAQGRAKDRLEAHGAKVIGPQHIIYRLPKRFEYSQGPDGKVTFDVEYSKGLAE